MRINVNISLIKQELFLNVYSISRFCLPSLQKIWQAPQTFCGLLSHSSFWRCTIAHVDFPSYVLYITPPWRNYQPYVRVRCTSPKNCTDSLLTTQKMNSKTKKVGEQRTENWQWYFFRLKIEQPCSVSSGQDSHKLEWLEESDPLCH